MGQYYAAAGYAQYDRHFLLWAQEEGFLLDTITQHDLHFRPELLDGYSCLAVAGHDEYWSWEMRKAVEAWTGRGGGFARFGGNYMWQIRLEDGGRGSTAKSSAPANWTRCATTLGGGTRSPAHGRTGTSAGRAPRRWASTPSSASTLRGAASPRAARAASRSAGRGTGPSMAPGCTTPISSGRTQHLRLRDRGLDYTFHRAELSGPGRGRARHHRDPRHGPGDLRRGRD